MKPKVVITHPVHPDILDFLAPHCEPIANQDGDSLPRERLIEHLADAEALLTDTPNRIDAELLAAAPRLKIVAGALQGCDRIDTAPCTAHGVWLSCSPDLLTAPAAELAVGLTLTLTRRVRESDAWLRSGEFESGQPSLHGLGIDGSRIGIIGMGGLGRAIAARLSGWGAELMYNDLIRLPEREAERLGLRYGVLDEVLALSDIVILALPLTPATEHLISVARLALMQRGAYLINPCRGSVADEAAVLAALRSGQLAGYAADVFELENWTREERLRRIAAALLTHPNALFTAQIGSAVAKVRRTVEQRAAESILQALAGAVPLDAINDLRTPLRQAL